MIFCEMKTSLPTARLLAACLLLCALPLTAQKKKDQIQKPLAGPRATALRVTWLYVSASLEAQKVDRVQPGRELLVAEKSGDWLRVFANTDVELEHTADEPIFDTNDVPPPISGWMQAKGVVIESTPNGDQILMGAGADEEAQANDPRGPVNAARTAHLLSRRLAEIFPNSPLAAEASWRSADISWQIQKADAASRPSAKEQAPYLRQQMDEDALKHIIRDYPHTKQADYAAFELLDNKHCGEWQKQTKNPEKESEIYEKFAAEHADGARTAQALYLAVYRLAVLKDMYAGEENEKKSAAAHGNARELATKLKDKLPQSEYSSRAAMLLFKLDQGIPVYVLEKE